MTVSSTPTRPAVTATLFLLGFITTAATAQEPDSSRTIPVLAEIRVEASTIYTLGTSALPRATISSDRIARWQPPSLAKLLQREAGMSIYDDLGAAAKLTLMSRGFAASPVVGLPQGIAVFIDGIPINEPDAGQVNFDLLPLSLLDRVELLSGTAATLGPHSLGGAVNLVTNHNNHHGGRIELHAGSNESLGGVLRGGGALGRNWHWFAGAETSREDGWRQLTAARRSNALVNIGRDNGNNGFRLQMMAAASRAETAGSLPESIYQVRPDSNLSSGDFEDLNQVHLAASGWTTLARGRTNAAVYYRGSDAERYNVNQISDPDVRSFSRNHSVGSNVDWTATIHRRHNSAIGLRLGLGGSMHSSSIRIFAERIDPGLTTDVESPITRGNALAMLDYSSGPLQLSAGARWDVSRVPFRNLLNPARDTTSVFAQLSPSVGVSAALLPNTTLFASAARSFRPPALIELACADPEEPCPLPFALGDDPPLNPVVATTIEAGLRSRVGAANISIAAYRTNVRDDIFLFPYHDENEPDGSTIDGFFANIEQTRREGIELAASTSLGALDLFANYGWTRATFQVDGIEIFSIREFAGAENEVNVGDRLPLIPGHTATLGGSLWLGSRVWLGLEAHHTGQRWLRGDEANDEPPLPAYWVVDGSVGVAVGPWQVRLIGRNLLDNRHATFGTFNLNQGAAGGTALERFLTPAQPRRLTVSLGRALW